MSLKDVKEIFVAVRNLSVIWVQAQRPFREAWAKEIADDFDPDKFDPPVITKPNGEGVYHIVEGQHRVWAAKREFGENEQIKCRMVDADEPARAAEIFLGINAGRKAIKPVAKFVVSVTANREPETKINRFVNKIGYRISADKSDYSISAVSALVYVHERQGMDILQATLAMLDWTWPGDAAGFQGDIIKGYAVFINEFRHADKVRLTQVITKNFSPNTLLRAARLSRDQHRRPLSEAMSEILRSYYNKGLAKEKQLKKK